MPWRLDCCGPSQTPFSQWQFVRSLCLLLVAAIPILVGSGNLWALEFVEARWGFNGSIQRHQFNLCSIDLINPSPEPFQGSIELSPIGSIYSEFPLVELDVYIAAGASRTVQFTPYIGSEKPDWKVVWGRVSSDRAELSLPQRESQNPVAVQFRNPEAVTRPIGGIEAFSDFDFPIGAPGTETLGTVVLDHVPRWDEVRRRAFRDWLGRGGQLFLINTLDGTILDFPAPLEELNIKADRFQVGQGTVVRHAPVQDAGEITELAAQLTPTPANTNPNYNYNNYALNPRAAGITQLIRNLQGRVRPNHNWPLIFFLAFTYLLILFPGIWIFSRKRGDFRVTYVAVLGTVAIFSWLYAEIGKRGYDETTGLHEMMIAEPLGQQRVLRSSYGNLFVTDGGDYPLTAPGEGTVFTLDAGGADSARFSGSAMIVNRPDAKLIPDVPPFSSCSFHCQSIISSQLDYSLQVTKLDVTNESTQIEARIGAGIPNDARVIYVSKGGTAIELTQRDGKWVGTTSIASVASLFPISPNYGWNQTARADLSSNLRANLVQVATQASIVNQYGYAESTETPATGAQPTGGYLIAIADAPAELLCGQYGSTGTVLFLTRVSTPTTNSTP